MPHWNDFKGNDATPLDRLLLLMAQPQMFDATEERIYDILVGYWHAKKWNSLQPIARPRPPMAKQSGCLKWAELPDHSGVTLRSQVGLSDAQR
jgi:hypothetical protein